MATEHVILGVISLYPCSGYDIKTELETGGAGLFSGLSFGSIYPKLKELEDQGLIETRQSNTGGRSRKLHELTPSGWQELSNWLATPSAFPIPTQDELLLKMGFWGAARPEDRESLVELLEMRREESLDFKTYLEQWSTNGVSSISEYGGLLLDYMLTRLDAELGWIERATAQLSGEPQPPVQDPNGLIPAQRERRAAALAKLDQAVDG